MTKGELKVVRTSHVQTLAAINAWDFADFYRHASYEQKLSRGTCEKAWRGERISEDAVIRLAKLFGKTKPYVEIMEVEIK